MRAPTHRHARAHLLFYFPLTVRGNRFRNNYARTHARARVVLGIPNSWDFKICRNNTLGNTTFFSLKFYRK